MIKTFQNLTSFISENRIPSEIHKLFFPIETFTRIISPAIWDMDFGLKHLNFVNKILHFFTLENFKIIYRYISELIKWNLLILLYVKNEFYYIFGLIMLNAAGNILSINGINFLNYFSLFFCFCLIRLFIVLHNNLENYPIDLKLNLYRNLLDVPLPKLCFIFTSFILLLTLYLLYSPSKADSKKKT